MPWVCPEGCDTRENWYPCLVLSCLTYYHFDRNDKLADSILGHETIPDEDAIAETVCPDCNEELTWKEEEDVDVS